MITFEELCDKLSEVEETILLEILELNAEDIVARFTDIIEDKKEYLMKEFEDGY